ncbi:MAG TPA: T9SS type A sorting domain-containing protein, partial [Arachidicoccus sp.]
GGLGGSLGYAANTSTNTTGLAGGYLGIGLDEYGNYSHASEGRNGAPSGDNSNSLYPNAIAIRDATTSDASTTNKYILGTGSMGASNSGTGSSSSNNSIDYDVITPSRPSDDDFYRRVQIEIVPVSGTNQFQVTVRWAKTPSSDFVQLMQYTTTTPPPPLLKLGFSASTGGGFNYHDLRTLIITTPGNIRVVNSVNKSSIAVNGQLAYTVTAYNDTNAPLQNLAIGDTLRDGNGNIIDANVFHMDSIKFNNNGNSSNSEAIAPIIGNNPLDATVNIAANSSITYTVYGTVEAIPAGGVIQNKAVVYPSTAGITDGDATNDTSSVYTNVISTDISLSTTHDNFSQGDNAKNITLNLINNGPDATISPTTVTDTLPAGITPVSASGTNWIVTVNGQIVTAIYNGSVANGSNYPALNISVNIASDAPSSVTNVIDGTNETDTQLDNNKITDIITISAAPLPINLTFFDATPKGTSNILTWSSGVESSIKGFDVQSSPDGKNFNTIVFVEAKGSNNSYSYIDATPLSRTYYRLAIINTNNDVEKYSDTKMVDSNVKSGIVLYPNPTNTATVTIIGATGVIVVYDALGRTLIQQKATTGSTVVNVSRLTTGLYFVLVNGKTLKLLKK